MHPNFIKPDYNSGGFAGLPERIFRLATSGSYDAVIFFLVDGFGWRFFEKFQGHPFLGFLAKNGAVEKLTAQFPSTTTAHVTTLHTGLPVGESGLYEWYIYEPLLDAIYAPLLFSYSGTLERDTLKPSRVNPKRLYPTQTLYNKLKGSGVKSHFFQSKAYTPSTYSNVVNRGCDLQPYRTLPEALVSIRRLLEKQKRPTYIGLYYDTLDGISHPHGPSSEQIEAEILAFLAVMQALFARALASSGKRVCFLLTADHGQVDVDPRTTVYLNRDKRFAGIEDFLAANRSGQPLIPAGSARDLFLHLRPDRLDEAQAFLAARLDGIADVVKSADLIEGGWFGEKISQRFRERVGDLVVLPYAGQSVWWYEKERFEMKFRGHHGGLTPQEIEIPLVTLELG